MIEIETNGQRNGTGPARPDKAFESPVPIRHHCTCKQFQAPMTMSHETYKLEAGQTMFLIDFIPIRNNQAWFGIFFHH